MGISDDVIGDVIKLLSILNRHILNTYTGVSKNCAFLFLSELRRISTNFDKFW